MHVWMPAELRGRVFRPFYVADLALFVKGLCSAWLWDDQVGAWKTPHLFLLEKKTPLRSTIFWARTVSRPRCIHFRKTEYTAFIRPKTSSILTFVSCVS